MVSATRRMELMLTDLEKTERSKLKGKLESLALDVSSLTYCSILYMFTVFQNLKVKMQPEVKVSFIC